MEQSGLTLPEIIRVAVFTHPREGRKPIITAYTLWYAPSWKPCMHHVPARNGTEAKKIAIRQHREHCMEKAQELDPQR